MDSKSDDDDGILVCEGYVELSGGREACFFGWSLEDDFLKQVGCERVECALERMAAAEVRTASEASRDFSARRRGGSRSRAT